MHIGRVYELGMSTLGGIFALPLLQTGDTSFIYKLEVIDAYLYALGEIIEVHLRCLRTRHIMHSYISVCNGDENSIKRG